MSRRSRRSDPPLPTPPDTRDLLTTLEATLANLRAFTERLQVATVETRDGDTDQ